MVVPVDYDQPRLSPASLPDISAFTRFHPFIRGVFSQWHQTPFVIEGKRFVTAEQWMMFAKATLFDDEERAVAILATSDPSEQKRHGQLVYGFNQEIWDQWKLDIVYAGNLEKFRQNSGAARQLRSTGDALLVEANVRDWIWGVGLAIDDPAVHNPSAWRGTNFLGCILTLIRTDLGT